jgi:hypothetical protein
MVFKKIDADSSNSITTALDFFSVPPTNTTVSSSTWREYLPLNPITDVPYRFRIYSTNNYLDLSKVYLMSEMRIRKIVGGAVVDLEAGDAVASINYIGQPSSETLKYQ